MTSYRVGDLLIPDDDDPVFDSLQDASDHALQLCDESDENIVGVWTADASAYLVAIAYQGDLFQK